MKRGTGNVKVQYLFDSNESVPMMNNNLLAKSCLLDSNESVPMMNNNLLAKSCSISLMIIPIMIKSKNRNKQENYK